MPRQANGTYIQPANTAAVTLTSISSVAFNTLETDIGTEITNSLDRLGRSAMQAALPMGNNKITGLAIPTLATDAVTKAYADSLGPAAFIVTGGGTADVITGVFTPTITSLTNGLTVEVRATAANATTTPTFQADATAAKTIVKGAGIALIAGNIAGAGFWMSLTYDSVLDKWVLNNPAITLPVLQTPLAGAQGLVITNNSGTPNSIIDITADQAVMLVGTAAIYASAVSVSVNTGTIGVANGLDAGSRTASTWYNLFLINNGTTTAGLASLSATAPTMPSGYTYFARVGAMRTDGSGNFLRSRQVGNKVTNLTAAAALPLIQSGNVAISNFAVANFVPPTAGSIYVNVAAQTNGAGPSYFAVAGYTMGALPLTAPVGELHDGTNTNAVFFYVRTQEIFLLGANISFGSTGMSSISLQGAGWRDKVTAT